jgi:DNA-binding NtrC family response regulator
LRDRKQDILPLAEHFLLYFSSVYGKKIKDFSPSVKSILLQHSWPGNVRELKNFIERAVIFTQGEQIEMDVVPDQYRNLVENQEKDTLSKRIEDTPETSFSRLFLKQKALNRTLQGSSV